MVLLMVLKYVKQSFLYPSDLRLKLSVHWQDVDPTSAMRKISGSATRVCSRTRLKENEKKSRGRYSRFLRVRFNTCGSTCNRMRKIRRRSSRRFTSPRIAVRDRKKMNDCCAVFVLVFTELTYSASK